MQFERLAGGGRGVGKRIFMLDGGVVGSGRRWPSSWDYTDSVPDVLLPRETGLARLNKPLQRER